MIEKVKLIENMMVLRYLLLCLKKNDEDVLETNKLKDVISMNQPYLKNLDILNNQNIKLMRIAGIMRIVISAKFIKFVLPVFLKFPVPFGSSMHNSTNTYKEYSESDYRPFQSNYHICQ
jgi:hypothetical protein